MGERDRGVMKNKKFSLLSRGISLGGDFIVQVIAEVLKFRIWCIFKFNEEIL